MNPFSSIFKHYMPQEIPEELFNDMQISSGNNSNHQWSTGSTSHEPYRHVPGVPAGEILSGESAYGYGGYSSQQPQEYGSYSTEPYQGHGSYSAEPYQEYNNSGYGAFTTSNSSSQYFSQEEYRHQNPVASTSSSLDTAKNSTIRSIIYSLSVLTGTEYDTAKSIATEYGLDDRGMSMNEMFKALKEGFGVSAEKKASTNWSSLPDTAMVEIKAPDKSSGIHWVVAKRDNSGKQYICDSRNSSTVWLSDHKLTGEDYFAISSSKSRSSISSSSTSSTQSSSNRSEPVKSFLSAIAELAGVDYDNAKTIAAFYGYDGSGMSMNEMLKTLRDGFNLNVEKRPTSKWSKLPDTAMVEIQAPEKRSGIHWVVAKRNSNGKQYIYDHRNSGPVKLGKQKLTGEDYFTVKPSVSNSQSSRASSSSATSWTSSKTKSNAPVSFIHAISEMAGVSYERAKTVASRYGYDNSGMSMTEMLKTLRDGFDLSIKKKPTRGWSSLPDKAMVEIKAPEKRSGIHWVVAMRDDNGRQYISDSRKSSTVWLKKQELTGEDHFAIVPPRRPTPISIVESNPYVRSDCGICALACATGEDYDRVLKHARDEGFVEKGMSQERMLSVLKDLGHTGRIKSSSDLRWSELPDLAVISVYYSYVDDTEDEPSHAVVFQRDSDGSGVIYDSNYSYTKSQSDYKFSKDSYLEIDEK